MDLFASRSQHRISLAKQRLRTRKSDLQRLETRQMLTSVANLPALIQGVEETFVDVDLSAAEFTDEELVVLAISSSAGRFQLSNPEAIVSANLVQDNIVLIRGDATSINTFFDRPDSIQFAVDPAETETDAAAPTIEVFDYEGLARRSLGTIRVNLPPQQVKSEAEIWFGAPELIDQDAGVHPLVPGFALWMYTDPIEWRFCNYRSGWCFEVSGSHLQLEDEGIEFAPSGRGGNRSFEFQDGTIFQATQSPDDFHWIDVRERPAIQDYIGTPIIGRIPSENLYFEILPEYARRVCPRCDPNFPENGAGFAIEYGYQISTDSKAFQTTEDAETATVDLLDGYRDPEGDLLSVASLRMEPGNQAGITVGPNLELTVDPSVYDRLPEGTSELIRVDFTIADEMGGQLEQTIDLVIQGRNDLPTVEKPLVYQVNEGDEGLEIDLLESASDVDRRDRLTIGIPRFIVDGQSTGPVPPEGVKVDGSVLTFDPAPYSALQEGETSVIRATYFIQDQFGGRVRQTLEVTVNGSGNPPRARDDWFVTAANTSVTYNMIRNDSDDAELDVSTIDLNPQLAGDQKEFAIEDVGTFRLVDEVGTIEFTPTPNYFGTAIASYTIRDNEGFVSSPGVVRAKVNRPPTALPDVGVTLRGGEISIPVGSNDVDADGTIDIESVDLDPHTPGQQSSFHIAGVGTFTDEVTDLQKAYTLTGIIDSSVGGESFRDRLTTITTPAEFVSDSGFSVRGATSFFIEGMGRIVSSSGNGGKLKGFNLYFHDGRVTLVDGAAGHAPGTGFVYRAENDQFEAFGAGATILPVPATTTAGPYGYWTTGGIFGLSNIRDAVFQSHDPRPRRSGNITFTPDDEFVGDASISYTIKDENGFTSNPIDLTVTVIPDADASKNVITFNESAEPQTVELLSGEDDPLTAVITTVNIVGDDRGVKLIGSQLHVEPDVYRALNDDHISIISVRYNVNQLGNSETRAIEIRVTGESEPRLGDLDGDGVISLADFAVLRWNFGSTQATHQDGDLNDDAVVDFQDYVILKENLGHIV